MTQEPLISLPEAAIVGIAPIGMQAVGTSVFKKKFQTSVHGFATP